MKSRTLIISFLVGVWGLGASVLLGQDSQEPNDTPQGARALGTMQNAVMVERKNLTFHDANDKDWFSVTLASKMTIEVWVYPDLSGDQNLFIELEGKDGTQLTSNAGVEPLHMSYAGLDPGEYRIEVVPVSSFVRHGTYRMTVLAYERESFAGWLIDHDLDPMLKQGDDPGGDGVPLGVEWALKYPFPDAAISPSWAPPILLDGQVGSDYKARQYLPFDGTRGGLLLEYSTDMKTWTAVPSSFIAGGGNPFPAGSSGNRNLCFPMVQFPKLYLRTKLVIP